MRSGIDTLIVSVDGATQETYEHYRAGGSLEKVKQGIRNLAAAKKRLRRKTPFIYIQFLVMRHNEHEIPAMEQLARELEVDKLLRKNIQVETLQEAQEWLGWMARFAATDNPTSSAWTRQTFNWQPDGPGLLQDMRETDYFR